MAINHIPSDETGPMWTGERYEWFLAGNERFSSVTVRTIGRMFTVGGTDGKVSVHIKCAVQSHRQVFTV
ncbi:polyprenyl synthetase [Anopheles sinensis]|uniref:Polyprenyl synthetase n=1 Tax=Anopheles sinensis TaxID=74873 RepID=A0A084VE08_ANOSI|nr:polyprenyl synthetase [Anopheles sinensis]